MKVSYGISMPVMALRGISVFPQMVYSFDVGREKSIRALDEAMNGRPKHDPFDAEGCECG